MVESDPANSFRVSASPGGEPLLFEPTATAVFSVVRNPDNTKGTKDARALAAIEKEIQAGLDKIKNDAQNSNLQKFLNNLESRIYAQISQNLATAMFANGGSSSGTLNFEGNTMFWTKDSSNVYLTVTDTIGTQTSITIPLGQFQF